MFDPQQIIATEGFATIGRTMVFCATLKGGSVVLGHAPVSDGSADRIAAKRDALRQIKAQPIAA